MGQPHDENLPASTSPRPHFADVPGGMGAWPGSDDIRSSNSSPLCPPLCDPLADRGVRSRRGWRHPLAGYPASQRSRAFGLMVYPVAVGLACAGTQFAAIVDRSW